MTLDDFTDGMVPNAPFQWKVPPELLAQIKAWIASGHLVSDERNPDPVDSMWRKADPGIDKSRWPYKCGVDARRATKIGKEVKPHGLQPGTDTHRHWQAGWDAGG
jgi:hypothetical protein